MNVGQDSNTHIGDIIKRARSFAIIGAYADWACPAAAVAEVYIGGQHTEVALMARTARDRGYSVQIVSGDAMATEEFALIAGRAAEDTLFTFVADPRRKPEAAIGRRAVPGEF